MVTVRKPGPNDGPCWQIWTRLPSGNWRRTSSGTTDKAKARSLAALEQADYDAQQRKVPSDPTLADVLRRHLAHVDVLVAADELQAATASSYARFVDMLLRAGADELRVNRARRADLGDVRRALRALSLAPSVAERALKHAGTAWRWAADNRDITGVAAVWPGVPRRKGKAGSRASLKTRKRGHEPWELDALLEELRAKPWAYRAARVLAETGARVGELLASDVRDLALDARGRWGLRLRAEVTKTGESRWLPLLPEALDLIGAERESGPLLLGPDGEERARREQVEAAVRGALRRLGLLKDVSRPDARQPLYSLDVHSFRRSFRTHAERAGITPDVRRKLMGHRALDVHDGYANNYEGDDLHAEVEELLEWRRRALALWVKRGRPGATPEVLSRCSPVEMKRPGEELPTTRRARENTMTSSLELPADDVLANANAARDSRTPAEPALPRFAVRDSVRDPRAGGGLSRRRATPQSVTPLTPEVEANLFGLSPLTSSNAARPFASSLGRKHEPSPNRPGHAAAEAEGRALTDAWLDYLLDLDLGGWG